MKKLFLFLSLMLFTFTADAGLRAYSMNCSQRVKPTAVDSLAVAFVCSPHTYGIRVLDTKIATQLNEIFSVCSNRQAKNARKTHRNWLTTVRNPITDADSFKEVLEARVQYYQVDVRGIEDDAEEACNYYNRVRYN